MFKLYDITPCPQDTVSEDPSSLQQVASNLLLEYVTISSKMSNSDLEVGEISDAGVVLEVGLLAQLGAINVQFELPVPEPLGGSPDPLGSPEPPGPEPLGSGGAELL